MAKEVEMKDAPAEKVEEEKKPAEPEESPEEKAHKKCMATLSECISILRNAVDYKETKLLAGRVLRKTASVRKTFTAKTLQAFITETLPAGSAPLALLLASLAKAEAGMDTDTELPAPAANAEQAGVLPEVEIFCYLLVIMFHVDKALFAEARDISITAVNRAGAFNRRTLDVLAARLYHYYSWCHESLGHLEDIRSVLLSLHRTATLRHDEIGAETLLNLLLRNYLHFNLYDQAEKLRAKAQQPDASRSSQQYARYLYYMGRIRAIQLEYTEAKECLQQAARKAPGVAMGFRVIVSKWLVLVRLLLGDIPERNDFDQDGMVKSMQPYFHLTQAVRVGDLSLFRSVAEKYAAVFQEDKTSNLIVRLRHNVIRTGLRRINLAYNRISLKDIGTKLGLAEGDDVECIVAKAIRDGGIDATINHERGCMESVEVADIYSTHDPMAAFHGRVSFCLDLHNQAVRAMRFEPDAHKKSLESEEARRERLQQEQELAQHIQEDDDEDF